jgi:hypothetical protein
MRRALLTAILATPGIAAAQLQSTTPGQLAEVDTFNVSTGFSYINAAHCAGAPLSLEWNIQPNVGVGFQTGGTYRIIASDTAPGTDGFCPEQDSTSPAVNTPAR